MDQNNAPVPPAGNQNAQPPQPELQAVVDRVKTQDASVMDRMKASSQGFEFMKLFEGRVDRNTYFMYLIVSIVLSIIFNIIPLIGWILSLALIIISLGMGIRRFHDIGMSGWFVLVFFLPMLSGILTFSSLLGGGLMMGYGREGLGLGLLGGGLGLMSLALLVDLGFLIYLCVKNGDAETNAYGPVPDPKRDFFKAVLNT